MSDASYKYKLSPQIKKELKPLYQTNNWYNSFTLLLNWGLIALSITFVYMHPTVWSYLLSILIIGNRMRGFDNLMHEASHKKLFKNQTANKWIGCFLVAFPIFTSYTAYRDSHMKHHKFLWDPEKDPDTQRYRLMGLDQPQHNVKGFVTRHIFRPLLLFHVPKYIFGTIKVNILSKNEPFYERWARILFWFTVLSLTFIFQLWIPIFLFWLVPFLTTFQVIRYWAEMAEHAGLNNDTEVQSSRNTLGSPVEVALLHPHHDNFHLVHHLLPAVPHYHLKKAHIILMKDPTYRDARHCTGFFKTFLPGFSSVIDDICYKIVFHR